MSHFKKFYFFSSHVSFHVFSRFKFKFRRFFKLNNQMSFSEKVPKYLLIFNIYFASKFGKT